jgi:hypothetical protein
MTANNVTSRSLFLLCDKDNSEITTPSLLLPFYQNKLAIMTATHANLLLLPVQDGLAITMATHTNSTL